MTHFSMIILAILLIPIFIPMIFIPYWTRKTESFGVSIPEKIYYDSELKTMRSNYATTMSIVSGLTLLLFLTIYFLSSQTEVVMTIIYSIIVTGYLLCSFLIYLIFHRQMKQLKATENWHKEKTQHVVIHMKFHEQKLTISSWLYTIPFVISFLTIIFTWLFYDRLPEQIPINYNFSGEITNWVDKSYRTVLISPVTQLFLIITFLFINIMIAKSKQQVSAENPEESIQRNLIFRRRWSMFMYMTAIILTLMFSFMQLSMVFEMNHVVMIAIPLLVTLAIIVGVIVLSMTTGQGGSRITLKTTTDEKVIDRDDDQYWKLGQFYFNKDDPTLFLEKRFGIGWTINWARPLAWLTLLLIIVLAAGIPILLSL